MCIDIDEIWRAHILEDVEIIELQKMLKFVLPNWRYWSTRCFMLPIIAVIMAAEITD
jgi:hypothetical protein